LTREHLGEALRGERLERRDVVLVSHSLDTDDERWRHLNAADGVVEGEVVAVVDQHFEDVRLVVDLDTLLGIFLHSLLTYCGFEPATHEPLTFNLPSNSVRKTGDCGWSMAR